MPHEGALPQRESDAGLPPAELVCRKGTYRAIPAPDCTNGLASELADLEHASAGYVTELFLKRGVSPRKKGSAPRTPIFHLREWATYHLAATLLTHFPVFPASALCYFRLLS